MMRMTWVTDGGSDPPRLSRSVERIDLRDASARPLPPSQVLVVDVDLRNPDTVAQLRRLLATGRNASRTIMAVERGSRISAVQAYGLGASDLIARPVSGAELRACLARDASPEGGADIDGSVRSSAEALQGLFSAFTSREAVDMPVLAAASSQVVDAVSEAGYGEWIATVRHYHEGTYQHCLVVTGTAALFAAKTGMRRLDAEMLTAAALLHDIGKAAIPRAILDKPGGLDDDELAEIRRHPVLGHDYLARQTGLSEPVLRAVRHHHEYLDGSGYPDGLSGSEIADLTRIVTICDVYSALVERRAYKAPLSAAAALDILASMGRAGKLELALVKALRAALGVKA